MKTLQDCKNEVAQSFNYNSYQHFLNNPEREHNDWDFHAEMLDNIAKSYASELAKEVLKRASYNQKMGKSILNTEYQDLLK